MTDLRASLVPCCQDSDPSKKDEFVHIQGFGFVVNFRRVGPSGLVIIRQRLDTNVTDIYNIRSMLEF